MADGSGAPLNLGELNKVIQHNTDLDPDEEYTGEIHVDSAGQKWPVIKRLEVVTGRQPKRDADGNVMYHLRADGSRHRPMMESVVEESREVEFIKMPVGNGIVQRNYKFRPSPEELERQKLDRENERGREELAEILAKGGKSFADVVGAIKSSVGLEEPTGEEPAEDPLPDKPLERFRVLKARAEDQGMEVEGTGKNGAVTLADLEGAFAEAGATKVAVGAANEE